MNKTLALLVRALRTESRDIKSHLFRVGLACVVVLILLLGWLLNESMSASGLIMFKAMTWANWVFITLAAGTFFAIAISEETEQQTLGLLRMANIGQLSLLLGKWLPRMLAAVVLISIQFPFTWMSVTLGGVSWHQIWASYLMLLSHLVLVGNLGLLCSVWRPSSASACSWTFILLVAGRLAPFICWGVIQYLVQLGWVTERISDTFMQEVVLPLNSWSASGRLYFEILSTSFKGSPWSPQVISNLAMGFGLFLVSWLVFDRVTMSHMSGGPQRASLFVRLLTRTKRNSSTVWNWALGWKDFRQVGGGMRAILIKSVLYAVLFATIVYTSVLFGEDYWESSRNASVIMVYTIFWGLLPLELCFLAGKLFRPELINQTWSTLLTLPKSIPEIVYSKIGGAMLGLVPTLVVLSLSASPIFGDFLNEVSRFPGYALFIIYYYTCVVLAVHLSALFSISVNWAVPVIAVVFAAVIALGGNLLAWGMFLMGLWGVGNGIGGEYMGYSWEILLSIGNLILAGVIHYGIGLRLVAKGAEN